MSKKLLHKINYYFLENEETEKLISEFMNDFNKDFSQELAFQSSKLTEKENMDEEEEEDPQESVKQKDLHSLYKKIARKTHPDLHGDEFLEEFKMANEAYNSENWIGLIILGGELNIDPPDFNDQVLDLINTNIDKIESHVNNRKTSLVWQWSLASDQWLGSEEERTKIKKRFREAMGIDENEFGEFLKNKES